MNRTNGYREEVKRCELEIACAVDMLRAGHPDLHGLLLALCDWSAELRLICERD